MKEHSKQVLDLTLFSLVYLMLILVLLDRKSTLAGFSKDELQVEVADGTLSIKTVPSEKEEGNDFLHRGIAKRQFSRRFTLSDDVVVKGADLYNGLLTIDLERVIPEEKNPREIPINDGVKVVDHKVV